MSGTYVFPGGNYPSPVGSNAVDNIFNCSLPTYYTAKTNQQLNPWVNIALVTSYKISTVFIATSQAPKFFYPAYNTEIRIGDSSDVLSNTLCITI